jgi:hypothetical protein
MYFSGIKNEEYLPRRCIEEARSKNSRDINRSRS